MCFESRNVFSCGCEKPKDGAELKLCEFAKIKGIACNGTMIARDAATSSEIMGLCMDCLAKPRVKEKADGLLDRVKSKFRKD